MEVRTGEHPGFSAIRLRKVRELRQCERQWEARWISYQALQGDVLLDKAERGQWWPAMLPEFRTEKCHRTRNFLGFFNLATDVLGKPGLTISGPQVAQLMGCSESTASRMLAKLVTGHSDGKREEALMDRQGYKFWLAPLYVFVPTKRAKDPQTGKKLSHWQKANCYVAGPLMLQAQEAKRASKAKRLAIRQSPVEKLAISSKKNDMPSPCDMHAELRSSVPIPDVGRAPDASGALSEGDKVSPAATVDRGPAQPAKLGAGYAGRPADANAPPAPSPARIADQDATPASPRALDARFAPTRPIAPEILREIHAAVEAGADEKSLLEQASVDPRMACRMACYISGRTIPTGMAESGSSARDPRWHHRRADGIHGRRDAPPRSGR